ncbi:MAG: MBL fold metallo-hydrolase [Bacteroidota bacterium]
MRLRVLGSSSAGNATLVWNNHDALLIDCGFAPRYLTATLEMLDCDHPPIAGLLLTHAHGDHVHDRSAALLVNNRIPIFIRHELKGALKSMYPSLDRADRLGMLRTFDGTGVSIASFEVEAFPVPHDSPGGCFGFTIAHGSGTQRRKMTLATDLGFQEEGLAAQFKDSHAVVLESNHDVDMLERSGRPEWLKKRIREIGHLSNEQCAGLVTQIVRESSHPPKAFVVAHISQQCNTNELAVRTTAEALRREGHASVRVEQSFRASPSAIVEF